MSSYKSLPLTLEALSSQECEQYRITATMDIKSILRQIGETQTQVALYFADSNQFVLSHLLATEADKLLLSPANTDTDNQRLLQANNLTLVGWQHSVKIQIPLKSMSRIELDGKPALSTPYPTLLYRLQKREYFRLNMPSDAPLRCNLVSTSSNHKLQDITVSNISSGGIGLVYSQQQASLQAGEHYLYQIELPGLGRLSGTLEVKNINAINTTQPNLYYAGCEFKDLSRQADILLQRYVTSMQRATRQL